MTRRILIVDDDRSIRETLLGHFTRSGIDASAVESAEAALSRLAALDPDLLLTDVRMSGMDGLALLALVRERAPDVDVVVMTAFEDMKTAIAAMKAGAIEYLVKPLDLDVIDLTVERSFRERTVRRRMKHLSTEAAAPYSIADLVGRDPSMIDIYKRIGTVARSRTSVLVRGETGTGKEIIARAIHFNSDDAEEPFVAVNCTAVPEGLLESELFGHQRGAFTGATADRRGRFELAGTGTIFLDEIGDTSLAFQAKLLRVLQEREFYAVGSERPRRTEARVIAATHRPLETLVRDGRVSRGSLLPSPRGGHRDPATARSARRHSRARAPPAGEGVARAASRRRAGAGGAARAGGVRLAGQRSRAREHAGACPRAVAWCGDHRGRPRSGRSRRPVDRVGRHRERRRTGRCEPWSAITSSACFASAATTSGAPARSSAFHGLGSTGCSSATRSSCDCRHGNGPMPRSRIERPSERTSPIQECASTCQFSASGQSTVGSEG